MCATAASTSCSLAEALDHLSRDQEDIAGLYKRLRFAGVRLITLAEGEISELHIGLKGTMNALFLRDLADKTRRGLRGRAAADKSAGGIAYRYKVDHGFDLGRKIRAELRVVSGAIADPREQITTRRFYCGLELDAAARHANALLIKARLFHLRTALPKADFDWLTQPDGRSLDSLLPKERDDDASPPSATALFQWGLELSYTTTSHCNFTTC